LWVDHARILAALAVIFLHLASDVAESIWGSDTLYWWIANVYNSLVRWCVPVFVMISGLLLLDPNKSESLTDFYKKRVSRIMLPLIFWTLFFSAWTFVRGMIKGQEISLFHLVRNALLGWPYNHMWYLYMVIGLYLFTPFFRKIVKFSSYNELLFLCVALFIVSMINQAVNEMFSRRILLFIDWFLIYLPYFFAGHIINETKRDPPNWILYSCFLLSVILTSVGSHSLLRIRETYQEPYFYGYLSVTVVPMSISVMFILKKLSRPFIGAKLSRTLALSSLGIYLVHPLSLEAFNFLGISARSFHPAFSVPIVAALGFAVSFVAVQVISRIPYLKRAI
jgi:surface polysaccharide O-acyltransferase-like enzyme